nr:AMP-binding protein [Burkholderiales bacterium]
MNLDALHAAATVHALLQSTAARRGDASLLCVEPVTAQAYAIDAGELRYALVADAVERLRERYADAGFGHGHRVGVLVENRPAFFLHWWALNALGVSVVPLPADARTAELAWVLEHSDAT